MTDEGVQLVQLQRLDGLLALAGRGRWGDVGRGLVHPVGDALRVDRQQSGNPLEVHPIHVHLERPAADRQVVGVPLHLGRVGAPAVAALAAQGSARVGAGGEQSRQSGGEGQVLQPGLPGLS